MKYSCGTPEICPRHIVSISLSLPQTGEVMSLRLISIRCVFPLIIAFTIIFILAVNAKDKYENIF